MLNPYDAIIHQNTSEPFGLGPYSVSVVNHFPLPVSDGSKISLKFWLPTEVERPGLFREIFDGTPCPKPKNLLRGSLTGERGKYPSIFEFLPYFKDHGTAPRDHTRLAWFASHGYVCVRGDLKGTGASEGLHFGGHEGEIADCLFVIDWLSERTWSNGRVGMYGKSWGGCNSLIASGLKAKALRAIVSAYALDDPFSDIIHYMGGCAPANGVVSLAGHLNVWKNRPPHPENFLSLKAWEATWRFRLENSAKSSLNRWIGPQERRKRYPTHDAAILSNSRKIDAAVLVIGGLADGYTSASFRVAALLNDRSRAVIGPWAHEWPDVTNPGPRIDFVGLCLAWWDFHLKGPDFANENVLLWPKLQVFMRTTAPPANYYDCYPGFWQSIPSWDLLFDEYTAHLDTLKSGIHPPQSNHCRLLFLNGTALGNFNENQSNITKLEPPNAFQGAVCGEFISWGRADLPGDQRKSNSLSSCWTSSPLEEDFVLAGFSALLLRVQTTGTKIGLAARLCDVRPTGEETRITFGLRNLCNWSEETVSPIPPNRFTTVCVDLKAATYVVPKGNRLKLAISTTYFPMMMPLEDSDAELFIDTKQSRILYQTLPKEELGRNSMTFPPPKHLLQVDSELEQGYTYEYKDLEPTDQGITSELISHNGTVRYPVLGFVASESCRDTFTTNLRATDTFIRSQRTYGLDFFNVGKKTVVKTMNELKSVENNAFHLHEEIEATINGETIYKNSWEEIIDRDFI